MGLFIRTVALGVGLVGAVTTSQLPEFAQQYTQRLGGAVDELRQSVAAFERDAAAAGVSLRDAIARLKANPDELAQRRGVAAEATVGRYEALRPHYERMTQAQGLERALALAGSPANDIARRTFDDFKPAVPLTTDGVVAGAVGFLLGLMAVWMCSAGTRKVASAMSKKGPPREALNS